MLILSAILAYLLGSVPFGIVIARLFGLGDLRQIGSGNIGATNVLRTGNKPAAALTLVLDAGKGAIAVLLARALVGESAAMLAGFMAFLGHCFPVYLGFRGGQGRGDLPGHGAGAGLAAWPDLLRHMAGGRRAVPLLVAGRAGISRRRTGLGTGAGPKGRGTVPAGHGGADLHPPPREHHPPARGDGTEDRQEVTGLPKGPGTR